MKFYFGNKLIRTSKTHVYTHALLDRGGKAITCSATREGCEKELARRIREIEQSMANHENALKAQADGKTQVEWVDGRRSFYITLDRLHLDSFADYIEAEKEMIRVRKQDWKIVELEAK